MLKKLVMAISFFMLTHSVLNANASVVINMTRIIFIQEKGEALVQLTNKGQTPLLVQSWIDDGDAKADPSTINVPFTISPPVVRIDPAKGQAIRILSTRADLPRDRESLFWFNILEIPPTASLAEGESLFQIAFRTRVKLLYRPTSLPFSSVQAYRLLKFSLHRDASGYQLVVKNPSPYFITFRSLELRSSSSPPIAARMDTADDKVAAPFSELVLPLPGLKTNPAANGSKIHFTVLNDSGGSTIGERLLSN